MTVEARPARFDGQFHVASLEIALTQGEIRQLGGGGEIIEPLPADQQPDQEDPVEGIGPAPSPDPSATPDPSAEPGDGGAPPPCCKGEPNVDPFNQLPAFQLFDRTTQRWVEFSQPSMTKSYRIANPEKYVDESGAVVFRFVNRADAGEFGEEQRYFQLVVRLDGTIDSAGATS
jgi:hypothetical protein